MGPVDAEDGIAGRPARQWLGALAVIGTGGFFAIEGASYGLGSGFRIGPGVFPLATGLLLVALGIAVAVERAPGTSDETFGLRPLLAVLIGIAAFGILVDRAGLYPATLALVLISGLGDRRFRTFSLLGSALVLSVFGHLVFIAGLGMPITPY